MVGGLGKSCESVGSPLIMCQCCRSRVDKGGREGLNGIMKGRIRDDDVDDGGSGGVSGKSRVR